MTGTVPLHPALALLAHETRLNGAAVPDALEGHPVSPGRYRIGGGAFLLRTGEGLDFHYRRGDGIAVRRGPRASPQDEALYLQGSVLAAVAALNALWPLHASAVAVNGRAVAFTGPSGAGKSTLVAALGARGLPLLCDDTLVLDPAGAGVPIALPGARPLRLTARGCALAGVKGSPVPGGAKALVAPPAGLQREPLPLAEVIVLEGAEEAALEPLRGGARLAWHDPAHYTTALFEAGSGLDRAAQFALKLRLARSVAITRFRRPRDPARFAAGIDLVLDHLRKDAARP